MWFTLALSSGLFQVLRNMTMKRIGHSLDDTINVWGRFAFLVPFAAIAWFVRNIPIRRTPHRRNRSHVRRALFRDAPAAR